MTRRTTFGHSEVGIQFAGALAPDADASDQQDDFPQVLYCL
jgi:hypothetical protein